MGPVRQLGDRRDRGSEGRELTEVGSHSVQGAGFWGVCGAGLARLVFPYFAHKETGAQEGKAEPQMHSQEVGNRDSNLPF